MADDPEDDFVFNIVGNPQPFLDAFKTIEKEYYAFVDKLEVAGGEMTSELSEEWASLTTKIAATWAKTNEAVKADMEKTLATVTRQLGFTSDQFRDVYRAMQEVGAITKRTNDEINASLDASDEARLNHAKQLLTERLESSKAVSAASVQATESEVEVQKRLEQEIDKVNAALAFQIKRAERLKELSVEVIAAGQSAERGTSPVGLSGQYGGAVREAHLLSGMPGKVEFTPEYLSALQQRMEQIIVVSTRLSSNLNTTTQSFQMQLKAARDMFGGDSVWAKRIDELNEKHSLAAARLQELESAQQRAGSGTKQFARDIEATRQELAGYEGDLRKILTFNLQGAVGAQMGTPGGITMRASQLGHPYGEAMRFEVLKQMLDTFVADSDSVLKFLGLKAPNQSSKATEWGNAFEREMQNFLIRAGQATVGEFEQTGKGIIEGFSLTGRADWVPAGEKAIADFKATQPHIRQKAAEFVANIEKFGSVEKAFAEITGIGADQLKGYILQLSTYGAFRGRTQGQLIMGQGVGEAATSPTEAARLAFENLQSSTLTFPLLQGEFLKQQLAKARAEYGKGLTDEQNLAVLQKALVIGNEQVANELQAKILKDAQVAAEREEAAAAAKTNQIVAETNQLEKDNVSVKQAKIDMAEAGKISNPAAAALGIAEKDLSSAQAILARLDNSQRAAMARRQEAVKKLTEANTEANQLELRTAEESLVNAQNEYAAQSRIVNGLEEKIKLLREEEQLLAGQKAAAPRGTPATLSEAKERLAIDRESYNSAVRTAQLREITLQRTKRQLDDAAGALKDFDPVTGSKAQSDALKRNLVTSRAAYDQAKRGYDQAADAVKRYEAALRTTNAQVEILANQETRAAVAGNAQTAAAQARADELKAQVDAAGQNADAQQRAKAAVKEYVAELDKMILKNREAIAAEDAKGKKQQAVADAAALDLAQRQYQEALLKAQQFSGSGAVGAFDEANRISATIGPLRDKANASRDAAAAATLDAQAIKAQNSELRAIQGNLNGYVKGVGGAEKSTKTWADRLFSLQKVATVFFGSLLSQFAYGIIGGFQQGVSDMLAAARDLNDQQIKLGVEVRSTQRSIGLQTGSVRQWAEAVAGLRAQFKNFSLAEWNQAAAQGLSIGREYGLTFSQMQKVLQSAAYIALKSGKDLSEATQLVARATREDLRGLNEYIGKIDEKADLDQRSLDMFDKRFEALTKEEQQMVRLEEVYERATRAGSDLNDILSTQESIVKQSEASRKDALAQLGKSFVPVQNAVNDIITIAAQVSVAFTGVIDFIVSAWTTGIAVMLGLALSGMIFMAELAKGASFTDAYAKGFTTILQNIETFRDRFKKAIDEIDDIEDEMRNDRIDKSWTPGIVDTEAAEELYDELERLDAEFTQRKLDLEKRRDEDLQQLELDHLGRIGEIDQEWREAQADAEQAAIDDAAAAKAKARADEVDAVRKFNQDIAKEQGDFDRDLARFDQDHAKDMGDNEAEFQKQSEKDLESHLRRMQEIRDRYWFRLLDAIRERDARGVLLALRDMNRDLSGEQGDFGRQQDERRQEHDAAQAEREADFQRQRARRIEDFNLRIAEMRAAHEAELGEIRARLQTELDEIEKARKEAVDIADAARQRDLDNENTAFNVAKIKRRMQYDTELGQLREAQDAQIREFTRAWEAKYNISAQMAAQIYNMMATYFGPGGLVLSMYQQMIDSINSMRPNMDPSQFPNTPPPGPIDMNAVYREAEVAWRQYNVGAVHRQLVESGMLEQVHQQFVQNYIQEHSHARGDQFMTNGPEWHLFGEGPNPHELVTAVPGSRLGSGASMGLGPSQVTQLNVKVTADEHFAVGVEDRIFSTIADALEEVMPVRRVH